MALTLSRTWPDRPHGQEDWLVMDDGVEVGRIHENLSTSRQQARWTWALSGAADRAFQFGIRGSGLARSLDDAKAEWREAYNKWLAWRAAHPEAERRRRQDSDS